MEETDLAIGTRVKVAELGVVGTIYESEMPDFGFERIYGVRLDEIAWPKNFVATSVWHCKASELSQSAPPVIKEKEMEAKDTVMINLAEAVLLHPDLPMGQAIAIEQAKVSFKAGMKEVVEWFNEQTTFIDDEDHPYYIVNKKVYQSQLKEWGLAK